MHHRGAFDIKSDFILCLCTEFVKINSAKSVLIVGGGPTGVELAGEIATDFPEKKVILVHRGSRLLEFIGLKASQKALDWLISKKVEVILDETINLNTISDPIIQTPSGEIITADCHFVCTGKPTGSSWLRGTIVQNNLDMQGRLMVDENLRVRGHKNIFAVGDITNIKVCSPINIYDFLCFGQNLTLTDKHNILTGDQTRLFSTKTC